MPPKTCPAQRARSRHSRHLNHNRYCPLDLKHYRLHILHHTAQEPLVGFWMIEELRRHGYEMSRGTIYHLLHTLEKKGYLSVEVKGEGRRDRIAGVRVLIS